MPKPSGRPPAPIQFVDSLPPASTSSPEVIAMMEQITLDALRVIRRNMGPTAHPRVRLKLAQIILPILDRQMQRNEVDTSLADIREEFLAMVREAVGYEITDQTPVLQRVAVDAPPVAADPKVIPIPKRIQK